MPSAHKGWRVTRMNPLRRSDSKGLEPTCDGYWKYMGFNSQLPKTLRLCSCYWLCMDCKNPVMWSGNKEELPSTTGVIIFDPNASGADRGDVEGGNSCLCMKKPGKEKGCDKDCEEGKKS